MTGDQQAKDSQHGDNELLLLSNDFSTVTGTSLDYRTVLGTATFSKGLHYWEVSVDRYDGNADIVIGVAQPAVNRQAMLGWKIGRLFWGFPN